MATGEDFPGVGGHGEREHSDSQCTTTQQVDPSTSHARNNSLGPGQSPEERITRGNHDELASSPRSVPATVQQQYLPNRSSKRTNNPHHARGAKVGPATKQKEELQDKNPSSEERLELPAPTPPPPPPAAFNYAGRRFESKCSSLVVMITVAILALACTFTVLDPGRVGIKNQGGEDDGSGLPTPPYPLRFREACSITTQWHLYHVGPEWTAFHMLGLEISLYCLRRMDQPQRWRQLPAGSDNMSPSCPLPNRTQITDAYHQRVGQASLCLCREELHETQEEKGGEENKDHPSKDPRGGTVCPVVAPDAPHRCFELSLLARAYNLLNDPIDSDNYVLRFLPRLLGCIGIDYDGGSNEGGDAPGATYDDERKTSQQRSIECLRWLCTREL